MQSRSFLPPIRKPRAGHWLPAALPLALAAALPATARADDAKTLDNVIVTATRTPTIAASTTNHARLCCMPRKMAVPGKIDIQGA